MTDPTSLEYRAMAWRNGHDTGLSSVALVSFLMGWPVPPGRFSDHDATRYPLDPDDLGRCIRALEMLPELRGRLAEAKAMSPAWSALIEHWDEIVDLYRVEVPAHRGRAPLCYKRMQEILYPVSA